MLSNYRVLDLTDTKGFLCGKILADLGADVIKIEPPGGNKVYYQDQSSLYQSTNNQKTSLFWLAYNLNKRSITLNLEVSEGCELLKKLVMKADILIESFPPGYMESLGLGYPVLREVNPSLIFTSISGFGQKGPYKDYKAPDIVGMAMGGFMYLTGNLGGPPLRISFPQAYLMASARAAEASIIAAWYRQKTGNGQWVDISMHECVVSSLIHAIPSWDVAKVLFGRTGQFVPTQAVRPLQRAIWPCKDGAIVTLIMPAGIAPGVAKSNQALAEWIESEGMADDFLSSINWETYDWACVASNFHDRLDDVVGRFFESHTRTELYEGAVERGIMLQPVALLSDVYNNPQLAARHFWVDIECNEFDTLIRYPGAFLKASATPYRVVAQPPRVGEHNIQVYGDELGFSIQNISIMKDTGII